MYLLGISSLKFLSYSADLLLALNVIVFSAYLFKLNTANKIFTVYLAVILIGEIISKIMIYNGYQNISMSHYYFILQFVFLSLFYLQLMKHVFQRRLIKTLLVVVIIFLTIQYYFYPELLFKFNITEVFITSFLILTYTLFHFYNILNEKKEYYLINSGILVYLFGSTIIFLSGNIILMIPTKMKLDNVANYINIILYIFYQILVFSEFLNIKKKLNN